jgi:glucan 1,3-beta-glucosidase
MTPSSSTCLGLAVAFALLAAAPAAAQSGAAPRPAVRVGPQCDTWYEATPRASNATFRNVKWYGAKGDGVTDDTAAFTTALSYNRSPLFTLSDPMVVYVPPGDYVISNTLVLFFYTHLIGNYRCPPRLLVPAGTWPGGQNFLLSGDTSYDGEHDDEFYRGIMHIDIVFGANNGGGGGIHWAVSQATFLRDMVIDGSAGSALPFCGVFDENGSGGFGSDLTIIGFRSGLNVGNQQWTWVNLNISGSSTSCINQIWNWLSVFVGVSVSNCPIGVQFCGNSDGSMALIDSFATNVPLVFQADNTVHIFLERFTATNVSTIVSTGLAGKPGGTVVVPAWRQGPAYASSGKPQNGAIGALPLTRPDAPLERRARPTFDADATPPVSALTFGAVGDGVHDDTAALQAALSAPGAPAVFLPFGQYLISSTLTMAPGGALVGELGSVLLAKGGAAAFADAANPQALLLVPAAAAGVRLVDLLFSVSGDVPGCVLLDWRAPSAAPSGLWDVSWRLYNTASDLFRVSGAGAGVYFEEGWGWVADHDIDSGQSLTVKNPRGMTITDSDGPSWLYGTAMEHSSAYQYNFSNANGITTVVTQTETDYWSVPPTGYAMVHENAQVQMYGSGWYNWFNGNQSSVWIATNSSGPGSNSFCINVHGVSNLLVGDVTIPANTPVDIEWFCDGYASYLGGA